MKIGYIRVSKSDGMISVQSDIATQSLSGDGGGSDNSIENAGIDRVLNKPFDDTDLKEAITLLKM